MKAFLALVKAWLSWAWSWVKWADAKFMAFVMWAGAWVIAHVSAYKKGYFWLVLGGSLASYFFWASIVGAFHWVADPMRQAMAPVEHVQSAPETLLPRGALIPTAIPAKPAPSTELAPLAPLPVAPAADSDKVGPVFKVKKVTVIGKRKPVVKSASSSPFPN